MCRRGFVVVARFASDCACKRMPTAPVNTESRPVQRSAVAYVSGGANCDWGVALCEWALSSSRVGEGHSMSVCNCAEGGEFVVSLAHRIMSCEECGVRCRVAWFGVFGW